MKKSLLIPSLMLSLIIMNFSAVSAIGIDVMPAQQSVQEKSPAVYTVTLYNDLERLDKFYFYVSGRPSNWVNVDSGYFQILPGVSRDARVTLYPNDVPGTYEYEIFLQSVENPDLQVSRKISLTVTGEQKPQEPPKELTLLEKKAERAGNGVVTEMTFNSPSGKEITVDYSVVNAEGATIATETIAYKITGTQTISHTLPLPGIMTAGTYTTKVAVKNSDIGFQSKFQVEAVRNVVTKEEGAGNPLYKEVRITVSNEGNVPEEDYRVTSGVPTGFVTFVEGPGTCQSEICEWVVSRLNPSESLQIIYRVDYWPFFLAGIIIAAMFLTAFVVAIDSATSPGIRKKIEAGSTEHEFTAVLDVVNKMKKVSNVVVRDTLSPLFKVKDVFETVTPSIKPFEDGTELVWELGDLEPGEHRILHYKLEPVIRGHLKVNRAQMRYLDSRGRKHKAASGETFILAS